MSIDSRDAKITSGKVSAFCVPTSEPEESDGTATWTSTTIIIVELTCGDTTGLGFTYSDETSAHVARELVHKAVLGRSVFDIPEIHDAMDRATRNMGRLGLVSTAISAIDSCLWDVKARLLGVPLATLLGQTRADVAAYGSGGFTSYSEKQLVNQMAAWAEE